MTPLLPVLSPSVANQFLSCEAMLFGLPLGWASQRIALRAALPVAIRNAMRVYNVALERDLYGWHHDPA